MTTEIKQDRFKTLTDMVHIMQKNFKWDRWTQRENLEQITRNEYVVDDS